MLTFDDFRVANLSANASDFSSFKSGEQYQHVYNAKVLDFQGGKAVLEVEGRIVVAESEVPLKLGGEFSLIVKGSESGGKVQLQIVGAQESGSRTVRPLTDGMISSRLMGFDLAEHPLETRAARSLLNHGVPVTKSNMEAMLDALPSRAGQPTIDFAASLLREGLPLSRELISLVSGMKQELDAIPANMKTVAEAAGQQGAASAKDVAQLVPPSGGNVAELVERLPDFVRAFLSSTEARLGALAELNVGQNTGAAARAGFIEQLVSILSATPETTQSDASSIDNAVRNLLQQLGNLPVQSETFEQMKDAFTRDARQALEIQNPGNRAGALRAAIYQALEKAFADTASQSSTKPGADQSVSQLPLPESIANSSGGASAGQGAPVGQGASLVLPDVNLAALGRNLTGMVDQFNALNQLLSDPNVNPAAIKEDVFALLARIGLLNAFQFDEATTPMMKEFSEAAGQWAKGVLSQTSNPGNTVQQALTNEENAALLDRVRTLMQNAELGREISVLSRHASDAGDMRAVIARLLTTPDAPVDAARGLASGLQYAGMANLAMHSGAAPMESLVTYFPFQIGDKVEIGKLQVYRRDDANRDPKKGPPPLDPFDASFVIILDTEFLGLSSFSFKTFKNKGIQCDIEVADARRKKFVEKYVDELRKDLLNTSYEQNTVNVKIRRRKSEQSAPAPEPVSNVVSIDLRI